MERMCVCIFRHPRRIVSDCESGESGGGWLVRDTITQHHVFSISSSTFTMRGILKYKLCIKGNPSQFLKGTCKYNASI